MKRNLLLGSVLSCIVAGPSYACSGIEQISWLLGDWQQLTTSTTTKESWRRVSDNTFEGIGSTISSNGTFKETLRIVNMSGEIFYLAKTPGNALPVAFLLQECSLKSATFVNTKHDFPQKIEYQLSSLNRLEVEVSAVGNDGFKLIFEAVQ